MSEDVTQKFNRYRFVVEVDADPDDDVLNEGGRRTNEVLRSEIKSNLESLKGIGTVSVSEEPTASPSGT